MATYLAGGNTRRIRGALQPLPKDAPLFSLVVSGQIKLRGIDGWRKIPAVLSRHTSVAA